MIVGILKVILFIPASNSLKHKRMILNRLKARLNRYHNVSVSQIGDIDKWQKVTLGISCIGCNRQVIDRKLEDVISYFENFDAVQLVNYEVEMI